MKKIFYLIFGIVSLFLGLFASPIATNAQTAQCSPFANSATSLGFTQELVASIPGVGYTSGYGFDSHGNLYTVEYYSGHLFKVDLSSTIPGPGGVGVVHPVIDKGYFTYKSGPRINQRITGGYNFTQYPDGTVYFNSSIGVVQVDLETATVTSEPLPGSAWGIVVDPQLNAHGHHNIITAGGQVVDPVDHRNLGTCGISGDGIAIDATGNFIFAAGGFHVYKRVSSPGADLPQFQSIGNYGGNPDGMAFGVVGTDQVVVSNDGGNRTVTMWKFPNNDFTKPPTPTVIASSPSGNEYGDQANVGPDGYFYITYWNSTIFPNCSTNGNASVVRFGPAGRFLPPTHSDNISLTPSTDTKNTGSSEVLTATQVTTDLATHQTVPVAGTSVTFTVVGGPDMGQTFTGTTDANGTVTFTLVNNNTIGDDVVHAQFRDANNNTQTSNNAVITFEKPKCTIPVFTSTPGNQTANTSVSSCDNTVNYSASEVVTGSPAPAITYLFSGATTGSGNGNGSGSLFNKGTTTVTLTATNTCGSATSTFTVNVTDNINPTISAPAAVSATTNTACTATGVVLGTAVTADNCSVASVTNDAPTAFPLGSTTVTWTVTDGSGNTATATQTVTVTDNINPTITAPAPVNTTTNTACTATGVDLGTPVTADNCSVASVTNDAPAAFPLGSTTVTWTVTDGSGNISTATQIVTVTDNINPTITAPAPVNATTNTSCTATGVVLGLPVTGDNCSVASVTNDAPTAFPLGSTTVTWTVTDGSGNTATATQIVTVTDNINPTITAPAPVNTTTNTACTATGVDLGTPVTADNCSVASVTNDAPAAFPLGSTTVTWTVKDGSGNTATATQTVTVKDNINPTITAPAAVNATTNTGCTATGVVLGTPVTADNCTVASVTNNAPTAFAFGSTTVTWTVTDGSGNTATATQVVTVTDNIKPVITCVPAQSFCANYGKVTTYTIPQVTSTDNCGVQSTSYAITGVTTRSGNGSDASGVFAVGTSTITWTVTDIHGNVSTCTTTVVIKPLPVASYVTTDANAFCNKLSLTASSTEPGSTYQWNTPAGTSASAASLLQLNSANADGVYTLYTTAKGCRSEFPVTYTYAKQNLINNYTLLGFKELDLGINNNVQSGSVGVTAVRGQAELRSGVSVASPGAFVKAARIDIDGVVNAPIRVLAPANPLLPTMIYNTVSSTKGYPNYQMKTATTGVIAGNYNSMTIKAGSNVTLSGTIYGSITVEKGATVAFTQGVVNIGSLQVGGKGYGDDDNDNKKTVTPTTYSYINFTGNTSVLVSSSVYFGLNTIVNKGNMKVTFYVGHKRYDGKRGCDEDGHEGDFNDNDETSFTVVGGDTKVTANVYAPNGRLQVKGNEGNDDENNWKWGGGDNDNKKYVAPTAVTYMTGMFIANQIESDARGVIWNGYDCGAGTFAPSIANQYVEMESKTVIPELTVKATPNPTTNYFMLNINSNDVKTEAVVRVVDGLGRPLDQFSHVTIGSSITFGQAYAAGYYFAEVTQGTQHKVVKLIKML